MKGTYWPEVDCAVARGVWSFCEAVLLARLEAAFRPPPGRFQAASGATFLHGCTQRCTWKRATCGRWAGGCRHFSRAAA
eukprot:2719828-Alexandrium_andersonii.AAC.1